MGDRLAPESVIGMGWNTHLDQTMRSGQLAGMVGGGYATLTWFDNCLLQSSHKLLKQNLIGYRYGIQEECAASNRLVGMKDELHEIRQ